MNILLNKVHSKTLPQQEVEAFLSTLRTRFEKYMNRHESIAWDAVRDRIIANPEKLWSLSEMERTGGEPDLVAYDQKINEYIIYDCSPESPIGRRNVCYDREALETRKEHKPNNSALNMATSMGIELLTEEQYRRLQTLGNFDTKTSSWIKTPDDVRSLGGALFGDYRYGKVFIYHNGAESYYGARGFRGSLRI